jgi:hypothetical protein
MVKPYETAFSSVLPVLRSVDTILAGINDTKAGATQQQAAQIELLIARGDAAMGTAKCADALKLFKQARAEIYRILYPGFDAGTFTLGQIDRILPTSVALERNLIDASIKFLDVVRPAVVATQPLIGHVTDVALDADLAAFTKTGFREAVSIDAAIQIASDNGIALLRDNKPEAAAAVMEQTLAEAAANGADVDGALLGALELNISSAALQGGDAAKADAFSRRSLEHFTRAEDLIGQAQALHVAAIAAAKLGDKPRADRLFASAADTLGKSRGATNGAPPAPPAPPANRLLGNVLVQRERPFLGEIAGVRANLGPRLFDSAVLRPPVSASVGELVTRDRDVLEPIALKDATTLTLRTPGRSDGWTTLALTDQLQQRQLAKPWSVGLQLGQEVVQLKVGDGATPSRDEVRALIYDSRVIRESWADLHFTIDGAAALTLHLTQLYAYTLLVKIADAYNALGQYEQAENNYVQAAGYSFLNKQLEGPVLWTRLARNAVEWGHARYKSSDLDGAKEQYAKVVTEAGTVPASLLYTTAALSVPAAEATTLIDNLVTRPLPAVNWEIAIHVLNAHQFLQQILDGLDFYGLTLSPIHTFEYLQSIARGFAQEAIQAEREFVNFKSRQEGEEATRRDLESAIAMAQAEVRARQEQLAAAREDESGARNALALSITRRDNARAQRDAYAASSWAQIWAQASASALGGGQDAYWSEISELADRLDRGETISGPGPKLAAAQILSAGRKTRKYELEKMQDNIDELTRAITLAQDQLDAATHRTAAAEIAVQAAQQRAAMAAASLDAFDDEFFTPESWQKMSDVMRDISRAYLFRAIRIGQLMERAYNFENDAALKIIKDDYGHGVASPQPGRDVRLLGGDSLLQDIDAFTYYAVTTKTRKSSRLKDSISVSADFPAQFEEFRRTGVLAIETDLYEFDRLHPGFYGQRIEDIEVKIVGVLPDGGLNGTLALGGVTRFRRKDGTTAERVHEVDTMALSDFVLRNDGFVYHAETGVRGLFQGFGLGTTWVLHLPKRSNAYDYRRIFDVQLEVYYTARFDAALRTSILTAPPRPDELARVRSYGLRYDFPDAWFGFYRGASTQFTLDRLSLPHNQTDFVAQAMTFRVVPIDGVAPAGIELRVTSPAGAGGAATTDAQGVVSTDDAALAGLAGIDPLGEWKLEVLGGPSVSDNGAVLPQRIYNIQVGLEYGFAYVAEEVI